MTPETPQEPRGGPTHGITPPPARSAVLRDTTSETGASERLRRAADLLERTANAATPGPWQPEYGYLNRSRVQGVFVECGTQDSCGDGDCLDGTHGIGGLDRDPDNRWAILLGPQVAGPLAAWLRAEADDADLLAAGNLPGGALDKAATVRAVAVADVILGGPS